MDLSQVSEHQAPAGDLVTVSAVAIAAGALTAFIHEGLGHGVACALAGGEPLMLNACFFWCDKEGLSSSAVRWMASAGGIANLVVAGLLLLPMRALRRRPGPTHYFLWLLFTLNVLTPFGYLLFSGVAGFGDWATVVDGFEPAFAFRVGLTLLGGALYFLLAPRLIMPDLSLYLAREPAPRHRRALLYSLLPYLVSGTASVAAGLLNPKGLLLVLVSAGASSFGGASLLAWYPFAAKSRPPSGSPETPAVVGRSLPWIAIGALALAIFVGVLGRGIAL